VTRLADHSTLLRDTTHTICNTCSIFWDINYLNVPSLRTLEHKVLWLLIEQALVH